MAEFSSTIIILIFNQIYQNKGKFDFEAQIPTIVYSTLISMV